MAKWRAQNGVDKFTEVEAAYYERDGDWIHSYDGAAQQIASYMALSVQSQDS